MSEQPDPTTRQDEPRIARSILRHSLILGGFAVIVALSVGLVNQSTREAIEFQRQQAERRALAEVMPARLHDNDLLNDTLPLTEASGFEDLALLGVDSDRQQAWLARRDGRLTGIILPVTAADGYSGDIDLIVGILMDGSLSGVRVVNHRETPGLGDRIELRIDDWILDFNGRSLDDPPPARWGVRKDGGDFDQFTGATITPRAVVDAVRRALVFFRENRDALPSQ